MSLKSVKFCHSVGSVPENMFPYRALITSLLASWHNNKEMNANTKFKAVNVAHSEGNVPVSWFSTIELQTIHHQPPPHITTKKKWQRKLTFQSNSSVMTIRLEEFLKWCSNQANYNNSFSSKLRPNGQKDKQEAHINCKLPSALHSAGRVPYSWFVRKWLENRRRS